MSKAKTLAGTVSTGVSVATTNGGTGQTGFTTGDILYSSATDTLAKLAIGSAGQVLKVTSGVPAWGTDSAGTGTVTSVAATVPSIFSISGSPITSSGTLAMTYSGTALPVLNGGTGLTAGTSGGVLAYTASGTLASSAALTQYGVVYGGGAGAAPVATAGGTTGQILTATTGGAPSFQTPASGAPAGASIFTLQYSGGL